MIAAGDARSPHPRIRLVMHAAPIATAAALEAEASVAAAFQAAARELGLEAAPVCGCWGATLYHPHDLPYAAFSGGLKSGAGKSHTHSQHQQQSEAADGQQLDRWRDPAAAAAAAPAPATPAPNADPSLYRSLPRTMTEFRRCVQAAASTRRPLATPTKLPPLPPGLLTDGTIHTTSITSTSGSTSGSSSGRGISSTSSTSSRLITSFPADVFSLYEAAGPGALSALQRLAALTNRPQLAQRGAIVPAYAAAAAAAAGERGEGGVGGGGAAKVGGAVRGAFPFQGGEGAAAERLEHILGHATGGLERFGETRCGRVAALMSQTALTSHDCIDECWRLLLTERALQCAQ